MSWCVYDSLGALITERRHPGESSAEMDPLTVLEARGPKQGVGRAVLLAKVLNWGIICRPVQLLAPSTFLCCGCVAPASPSPHGLAPRVSVSLLISQRHQLFETVPGGPVVGTPRFRCRGLCVQSQVGELRSYMPHSAAKKIFFNGKKKKDSGTSLVVGSPIGELRSYMPKKRRPLSLD